MIGRRLADDGYSVCTLTGMSQLDDELARRPPDILVMDAGPWADGLGRIPYLRTAYPAMGIVVLTARTRPEDRLNGLSLGADYYLTRPVSMSELSVTLAALARRLRVHPHTKVDGETWSFHPLRRQVHCPDGTVVALSEAEAALLGALVHATPRAVSRDSLASAVDAAGDYDTRRLDMLVYRLRRKLRNGGGMELNIRSVYGVGYVCTTEVNVVASGQESPVAAEPRRRAE